MARPKVSKNKSKDAPAEDSGLGGKPSKTDMTDEQLQGLFEHHKGKYEVSLAAKKAADAAFKNTCKLAKAEGVSIVDIKLAIDLEEEGGEERLREEIERKHRIARWLGLPVGSQPGFFDDEDRTPSVDKAEAEGKRAGLRGASAEPPHHFGGAQQSAWMQGWHAGQKIMLDRVGGAGGARDAEAA